MSVPTLRRNFLWATGGSVVMAISQWALQVLFTKLATSEHAGIEAAGTWSIATAVTSPVFVFFLFKLRAIQATDQRGQYQWSTYAVARSVGMAAAVVVTALIIAVRYRSTAGVVIAGVGLMKLFEGFSDLVYGQLQQREELWLMSLSQGARGVAALVVGAVAYVTTRSVAVVALASAATYAVAMVVDLVVATRRLGLTRPTWTDEVRPLLRTCVPLGMVTAIGSLQLNIPRYFLESDGGAASLGVFSLVQYLLFAGSLIITALANVTVPRLAKQVAAGDWLAFARLLRKLIAMGLGLGVLGTLTVALIGRPVLRYVYNDTVAAYADLLVLSVATAGLSWTYLFFGTALDAMRRYRIQPWIHSVSAVVITVASWIMVPRWSVYGAGWAMLTGVTIESILYFVAVAVPLRAELRRRREVPA
ncbi:MAG: lipopolysaccharide biosynthesis protein [Kofleriaceae bacterium]